MKDTFKGTIVMSKIEKNKQSSWGKGFVTICTSNGEYVKFDVDAYTKADTYKEGENVLIEGKTLRTPGEWFAVTVKRLNTVPSTECS
jgi:hypothetical protein